MYEVLRKDTLRWGSNHKFAKMDARYMEIVRRTGLNKDKVQDYVKIALYLPEEVKALLRQREDRTLFQVERLQGLLYRTQSPSGTLTVYKAKLILEELEKLPIKKQVEVAVYILSKTNEMTKKVVELVKKNPDKDLLEIEQILRKQSDFSYKNVRLNNETMKALSQASLDKQKELADLIVEIVEEWLKKNFYLSRIS